MYKNRFVMSVAALLVSSAAFAGPFPAEKLDSGLGQLPATYTAAEYRGDELRIVGESLDSGLGLLSPSYTGIEYVDVVRESLDTVAESLDSGLGEISKHDVQILLVMTSL